MQGKTVLITGADGDIGKNTTKGIAQKGAETSSYLACADEVKEIPGKYFSKKKPDKVQSKYNNIEIQKELWTVGKYLTKLI